MLRRFELLGELMDKAHDAFPGFVVVQQELVKYEENDEVVVDLVLIDFEGQRWWVARVVPVVSDFELDVFVPVFALSRTRYLSEDAEAVASHFQGREESEVVKEMILTVQPGVVVFVSNPDPSWYAETRRAGGQMAVLESFSTRSGDALLRINGELPRATGIHVADCEALPGMDHVLKVPGFAGDWPAEEVVIELDGELVLGGARVVGEDVLVYAARGQTINPDRGAIGLWRLMPNHFAIRPR
jgi:hypothetical protein